MGENETSWSKQDRLEPRIHDIATNAIKKLTDLGIKTTFYESKGTAHEWLTWRRDLYQFAPLLFK